MSFAELFSLLRGPDVFCGATERLRRGSDEFCGTIKRPRRGSDEFCVLLWDSGGAPISFMGY